MQSQKEKKKYEMIAQFIQVLANVAVVLGIIFAAFQLIQTKHIESNRLAVDVTDPTQRPDFLDSYERIMDAYNLDHDMLNTDSLRSDLSFVMNVYDNIAILYLHHLVDPEIIEARVHDGMTRLVPILEAKKWPMASRTNFDAALALMSARHASIQNTNIKDERLK
jgi:hypothetical protein